MKLVLITGKNSFIGKSLEEWLLREPDKYKVDTVDMQDECWKDKKFSQYDVVFHVAGIAHVSSKRKLAPLYMKINRNLAIQTAIKSKKEGIKQFIFMSSIIIYGKDNKIDDFSCVDINNFDPKNAYGQSKLQADTEIQKLQSDTFNVAIIRSPMIFGPGCKGNIPKLLHFFNEVPFFFNINNARSMIYIDNLSEFIRLVIRKENTGIFFPQQERYISTIEFYKSVKKITSSKCVTLKGFKIVFKLLGIAFGTVNKVFGNKTYDLKISNYDNNSYIVKKAEEAINDTVRYEVQQ